MTFPHTGPPETGRPRRQGRHSARYYCWSRQWPAPVEANRPRHLIPSCGKGTPNRACDHRAGAMVEDVVRHQISSGMPMKDVRSLFGPPEEVTDGGIWVYFVDFEDTGFLGTCVSLSVYPGTGDQVVGAEVVRAD